MASGHTAEAALAFDNVRHLDVVEYLEPVIDWHRRRLVPAAGMLMDDPRCRLVHDDFFDRVGGRDAPVFRRYEAILLDIDHSPDAVLHPKHAAFYTVTGLRRLATHLRPPGLFALWSADPLQKSVLEALEGVFVWVEAHEVRFFNHHLGEHDTNWIVIARLDGTSASLSAGT